MSLKSVLAIDVQDAAFQRFTDLFKRYEEALKRQPDLWKKIGKQHTELRSNFEGITEELRKHAQLVRETVDAGAQQAANLSRSEGLWQSISRASGSVLSNVVRTGEGFLKWAGIIGGVGALAGLGGSIFGLDRLMGGAATDRRASLGLGMGFGTMRSFDVNFQRLFDPGAFLGFINQMELDVTQQRPAFALMGHGLSGNTGRDALSMLDAIQHFAMQGPLNQLGLRARAYGIPFGADELRRLRDPKEYQQLRSSFERDTKTMSVPDKILKDWQELSTQLERAGKEISAVFIRGLAPLTPQFVKLSQSFVDAISAFMRTHEMKDVINSAAKWIGGLSDSLEGFVKKLPSYMDDIEDLFDTIHKWTHPGETIANTFIGGWAGLKATMNRWEVATAAHRYGVPKELISTVIALESRGNPNAVSPKGAMGLMGLMPATAKWAHVNDPLNAAQNIEGGTYTLAWLLKHYHEDMAKTLAAYNWGAGNVDKDIARYGDRWQAHLPRETKQYMLNAAPLLNAYGITVIVKNETGNHVDVTTNAGAATP